MSNNEETTDWKEKYYLEISTKILESQPDFSLINILSTMKAINESDPEFLSNKSYELYLDNLNASKTETKKSTLQFLMLFPYLAFSSATNDPRTSNLSEVKWAYSEQIFKKVNLLKQKLIPPLFKQNEDQSAAKLINKLSEACQSLNQDTINITFSKLYGNVWYRDNSFRTEFFLLRTSLTFLGHTVRDHPYFIWEDEFIPTIRELKDFLRTAIIKPMFLSFFRFYETFIVGRTIDFQLPFKDVPPVEGDICGIIDLVLYYSDNDIYKNFVIFIFKKYWKFDNISLYEDNGVKYSKAEFGKDGKDESMEIMREVCHNLIKYGVKHCVLSCGLKTYLFKLELELLLGGKASYEVTEIPISYTLFTYKDDIPLTTAITSIILGLSKLSQEELNLSVQEKSLLIKALAKPSYSMKHPNDSIKRPKIEQNEAIRFYCESPLLCEKEMLMNLNEDYFIGEILQTAYPASVYLITKQQFLECFDYPDPSSLPNKLVFKMQETALIDLGAENKNRHFSYCYDGLKPPSYLSDDRYEIESYALNSLNHDYVNVPKLYAYGHFQFKPTGLEDEYGPINLRGIFMLIEYIESNKFGIKDVLKLEDNDQRKISYYNKAKAQLKKIHEHEPFSIVHNDVAARNIIIGKNEELYIIDFSEAIIFEEKDFQRDLNKLDELFFADESSAQ